MGAFDSAGQAPSTSVWDSVKSTVATATQTVSSILPSFPGGATAGAASLFSGLFDGPAKAAPPTPGSKIGEEGAGRKDTRFTPATAAQTQAAQTIEAGYDKNKKYDPRQKIGNLDKMSPKERMEALNKLTQNDNNPDPKDQSAQHKCGPTALIAAAMVGGGTNGLQSIIKSLQDPSKKDSPEQKQLAEMMTKLGDPKSGGLNLKDLHGLSKGLYQNLFDKQAAESVKAGTSNSAGIGSKTISDYLKSNPELAKVFFKKDEQGKQQQIMNLKLLSNETSKENGTATANTPGHFVLEINDPTAGPKAVYDPYNRKGGQVVSEKSNKAAFEAYQKTQQGYYQVQTPVPQ